MRLTFADIKSTVAKSVNLCATDARVIDYTNQAIERLLWMGKYANTYVKFSVSVGSANTITWPRELESIERVAVGVYPISARSLFHEFLQHGFGLLADADTAPCELVDRPSACTNLDVGTGVKIRLYPGGTVDNNKVFRLQGLDSSGNRIYTEYPAASNLWVDGVNLTSGSPYAETTQLWSSLVSVQKPITQLPVTVKAYNPTTLVETTVGIWYPDETNPEYRRSLIPGLKNSGQTTVTVIGKLAKRNIRGDDDWVIPSNLPAIKLMTRAIWLEENDRIKDAILYEQKARQLLEEQLLTKMGGEEQTVAFDFGEHYGSAGIAVIQ
jgi:hypothetical protein